MSDGFNMGSKAIVRPWFAYFKLQLNVNAALQTIVAHSMLSHNIQGAKQDHNMGHDQNG